MDERLDAAANTALDLTTIGLARAMNAHNGK
jgi:hypothetical protein